LRSAGIDQRRVESRRERTRVRGRDRIQSVDTSEVVVAKDTRLAKGVQELERSPCCRHIGLSSTSLKAYIHHCIAVRETSKRRAQAATASACVWLWAASSLHAARTVGSGISSSAANTFASRSRARSVASVRSTGRQSEGAAAAGRPSRHWQTKRPCTCAIVKR